MIAVGIDVSKSKSTVAILDFYGTVLAMPFDVPHTQQGMAQIDALCDDVGMTTSTAVNMFAEAFIRERTFPVDVVASDPFYSESNKH